MGKMIYLFEEGDPRDKALLGGKGAGLAKMVSLGLPVPPGFTITTEQCVSFYKNNEQWPEGLKKSVWDYVAILEERMGRKFGSLIAPLLVSVRSGARESMPGMMDSILNVGINDKIVLVLALLTKNPAFAWDCYRRLIVMFGESVYGIKKQVFNAILKIETEHEHVSEANQLSVGGLKKVVAACKLVIREAGYEFPQDVREQLEQSVTAVFRSWNNHEAKEYRIYHPEVKEEWGTAVNVQSMVFGNMGDTSGAGVAFSRDSTIGEDIFESEWLLNAQGEDAVDGYHIPMKASKGPDTNGTSLEELMPAIYEQLYSTSKRLETEYQKIPDMVDIEFTIEDGKLWILQVRTGKRSGAAAVRIAIEMIAEGLITDEQAINRITQENLEQMLHRVLKVKKEEPSLSAGIPASPGGAVGRIVITADEAVEWVSRKEKVILVRTGTSPSDLHGMKVSEGILTACGGKTSHAALVSRQEGIPCVVGCEAVVIDEENNQVRIGSETFAVGDWISIDASSGKVYKGQKPLTDPVMTEQFDQFIERCNAIKTMEVWTNADTPAQAKKAIGFTAQGIGLVRTEHMLVDLPRLKIMQHVLLHLDNEEQLRHYVSLLAPYFRKDFEGIFQAMVGLPVMKRLLDAPFNEFLASDEDLDKMGFELHVCAAMKAIRPYLHEEDSLMGLRGVRAGLLYEVLYEMITRAYIEAALAVEGSKPVIMVPLVSTETELIKALGIVRRVAEEVMDEQGRTIEYKVSVMIETVRSTIIASKLAVLVDSFSFGSNDLTQFTFAYGRNDMGKVIAHYLKNEILPEDPFVSIDEEGVGFLMQMAVQRGRAANPNLKIGICGEHGGDPKSIAFCNSLGLDYISCSPLRVPIAIHAAAQAAINCAVLEEA